MLCCPVLSLQWELVTNVTEQTAPSAVPDGHDRASPHVGCLFMCATHTKLHSTYNAAEQKLLSAPNVEPCREVSTYCSANLASNTKICKLEGAVDCMPGHWVYF